MLACWYRLRTSNMKKLTPMARMKSHFDDFSNLTKHLMVSHKPLELTHREERYNDYGGYWSYEGTVVKAVKSDFIRIFMLHGGKSVAFKFDYLTEDKNDFADHHYVEIILKIDEVYYNSNLFDIDEAKGILRDINKKMKVLDSKEITSDFLITYFKENCVPHHTEVENLNDEYNAALEYQTAEMVSDLKAEIAYITNLSEQISIDKELLKVYSNKLPEVKKIQDLQMEITKLYDVLAKKKHDKKEELKIDEHEAYKVESLKKINKLENDIKSFAVTLNNTFKVPLKLVYATVKNLLN